MWAWTMTCPRLDPIASPSFPSTIVARPRSMKDIEMAQSSGRPHARWALSLLLVSILPSTAAGAEAWRIVPGARVGPLVAGMSEENLMAALPAGQVVRAPRDLEEGTSTCGTLVFAGTVDEFFVEWRDSPRLEFPHVATDETCAALPPLRNPAVARITQGRWRTADGIAVGISIDELDRITGRPTTFSVCGCDFRGRMLEGAPEGMSIVVDWPDEAEASIEIEPRHVDDYAITILDVAPAARMKFSVAEIKVDLRDIPNR